MLDAQHTCGHGTRSQCATRLRATRARASYHWIDASPWTCACCCCFGSSAGFFSCCCCCCCESCAPATPATSAAALAAALSDCACAAASCPTLPARASNSGVCLWRRWAKHQAVRATAEGGRRCTRRITCGCVEISAGGWHKTSGVMRGGCWRV